MSLLRARLLVDPRYVAEMRARSGQRGLLADVRDRAARIGLTPSLLEMQDPTDPRSITLLVRGRPSAPGDDAIRIVGVEPVTEPPRGTERADPSSHPFDPGLSVAEVAMLRRALADERNPRHLWGLASCLAPSFPVAASMLRARKIAVESNHPPPVVDGPRPVPDVATRHMRAVLEEADRRGIPRDVAYEDARNAAFLVAVGDAEEDMPASLRAVGEATARTVARGVRIVDRDALLAACPPTGEEGYVAPSAIQLALSTTKPEMAGVRSFAAAGRRGDMLKNPPRDAEIGDTLRARMAMIRAQKAIERHRWLRWYEQDRATRNSRLSSDTDRR